MPSLEKKGWLFDPKAYRDRNLGWNGTEEEGEEGAEGEGGKDREVWGEVLVTVAVKTPKGVRKKAVQV